MQKQDNRAYLTVWRWHFYLGVLIAPFLVLLAGTGLGMLLFANTVGRDGERIYVEPAPVVQSVSAQASSAIQAVGDGANVVQYIAPRADDMVSVFRISHDDVSTMVAVNPYTADVVKTYPRREGLYHLMDSIHGDMLLGETGDILLETAASLTVLMIVMGFYLWYQKTGSLAQMFLPKFGKGRNFWRDVHGVIGSWIGVMLLVFCVSGLAWANIWGGKMVQAWNQFPAGKWGVAPEPQSIPLNAPTHGTLNDGAKDVPWALELTPMPQSTPNATPNTAPQSDDKSNAVAIAQNPMQTLDSLDQFVRKQGITGRYQVNLPQDETATWVISQDSMSYDSPSPTADRTIHIDQYSGKVLADIRFDDYNAFGKFMAVSIAFHMGTMGVWSLALNVLFCLAVIVICISGVVMWFKRRPKGVFTLLPPTNKANRPKMYRLGALLLVLACIFPTAIGLIVILWLLDKLIISHSQTLSRWLK